MCLLLQYYFVYVYVIVVCMYMCVCVCTGGNGGMDRGMQDFSDNVQHFCKNGKSGLPLAYYTHIM